MPTINVGPGSGEELQQIADALGKSRKVVVITGAGISTNCGIPDFRSENGLYSLIQAQYDAAIQNPPWEDTNIFDIDDAPKKKRKPWFYEVVDAEGNVVKTIDPEPTSPNQQDNIQKLRRSRRSGCTTESTSRQSTPTETCSSSRSSSRRPSLRATLTTGDNPLENSTEPTSPSGKESQTPQHAESTQNGGTFTTSDVLSPPKPSHRSKFLREVASVAPTTSTSSSITNPRPLSRASSLRRQSTANALPTSSAPPSPTTTRVISSLRRRTLEREASSTLTPASDCEDLPSTQSSQSSSRASLPNLKGRDLFDSIIWSDPFTTSIFYMFVSSLRQKINNEVEDTTETHKFIRTLRDGGRLVRNYTQNIDCLEERVGLSTDLTRGPGNRARFHSKTQKEPQPTESDPDSAHWRGVEVVLLHGSLVSLRCGICSKLAAWDSEDRHSATAAGFAPDCPACISANQHRMGRGRRGVAVGRLRPDIVLYGEEHPNANLVGPVITHDLGLGPDVLLILGTSLKVHGLKVMVREFAKTVHSRGGKVVFINRTKPPESNWGDFIDYWVEWDCDEWVLDLKERRPDIWLPQGSQGEEKRRASTDNTKSTLLRPSRPQATRDDKANGVYFTFKILDTLATFTDSEGQQSSRSRYFNKPPSKVPNASLKSETVGKAAKKAAKPKLQQQAKRNQSSTRAPRESANTSRKRKSYPSAVPDSKSLDPVRAAALWDDIRRLAPGLPVEVPPTGRMALSQIQDNIRSWYRPFAFNASSNQFPTVGGADWGVQQMNLMTHPPSGESLPLHKGEKKSVEVARRATISHSYSTRASRRWSAESTIVVEGGSHPSSDTIVVDPVTAAQEETLPSPPISDAMTPSSQRIKRMGSIGAILSSSPSDGNSSGVSVYHDAME